MPEYQRKFVPGGTYFFTLVTHRRRRFLTGELARKCLREAIETIQKKCPFEMPAVVLLPDHLHAIWQLPPNDDRYPMRWRRIKEEFSESYLLAGGAEGDRSESRMVRHERGIWQRRFWEHAIESEHDFERHFDYIHYNPVKHGYVMCPKDYAYSTFHACVKEGIYEPNWGCQTLGPLLFDDLDESAME